MRMARHMIRATLAVFALTAPAFAARAEQTIRIEAFPSASDLQIWVAQDNGYFKKEGLSVSMLPTRGSAKEIRAFAAGKFPIMSTAFDNLVAYVEGQGQFLLNPPPHMFAFLGIQKGLVSLMSAQGVKTIAAIRGKKVAVDSPKTGYSLVLYDILRQHGLVLNKDYSTLAVGNTSAREKAMKGGRAAAGMISPPNDFRAQAEGFNRLAGISAIGAYQGSVFVTRRSWAEQHSKELAGFVRSIVEATNFIFKDKAGAEAILERHLRTKPSELDPLYAELTGPGGFDRRAALNIPGMKTVLRLRQEFGVPKKTMGPLGKYMSTSYYEKAAVGAAEEKSPSAPK